MLFNGNCTSRTMVCAVLNETELNVRPVRAVAEGRRFSFASAIHRSSTPNSLTCFQASSAYLARPAANITFNFNYILTA